LSEDMLMDVRIAREIKAFVDDGYSYYYYSRGKCVVASVLLGTCERWLDAFPFRLVLQWLLNRYQAAMQCSHKAMRAHASLDQWQHVSVWCWLGYRLARGDAPP
jgi:hypothetical protein